MPNLIAYAALALWPLVALALYRNLPPARALVATILGSYLFLPPPPAVFDLPLIQEFGKYEIGALSALLMTVLFHRDKLSLWPDTPIARVLVVVFILSPIGTFATNQEPVYWGSYALPPMSITETIGMIMSQCITILPFLLARNFLSTMGSQRDLLMTFVICGLVYSLPMLVEIRLSPQVNVWVYGYFQHAFDQMMRGDGFRPIMFLYHGLWVSFFVMTTVLAALALSRGASGGKRVRLAAAAAYMFVVLILCKSWASLIYAVALAPLIVFYGQRMQFRIAVLLAAFAMLYPVLKANQFLPEDAIISFVESRNADRAQSLEFRLDNETVLEMRALQKPFFGWGTWGRNHVMEANTGKPLTVTDGRWILTLGILGWVGFIAEFGLLCFPLWLIWHKRDVLQAAGAQQVTGTVTLILGVNMFDMLPNATLTPLTWLFAGALLGLVERPAPAASAVKMPTARHAPIRTIL